MPASGGEPGQEEQRNAKNRTRNSQAEETRGGKKSPARGGSERLTENNTHRLWTYSMPAKTVRAL